MSDSNPFSPPQSNVEIPGKDGNWPLGRPRRTPAGHGWHWIADAFRLFAASPVFWIVNTIVYMTIIILMSLIPLVSVAVNILNPIFIAGFMISGRKLDEGNAMSVGDLFAGFQTQGGKLAAVGALSLAATILVVMMVILIGMVFYFLLGEAFFEDIIAYPEQQFKLILLAFLFYLALVIPVLMALWFAPALIVFHDVEVFESFKLSFMGCIRNIIPFLVNGLIMSVFLLLATIPFGLGLFVLVPVMIATMYTAYKDIFVHTEYETAV